MEGEKYNKKAKKEEEEGGRRNSVCEKSGYIIWEGECVLQVLTHSRPSLVPPTGLFVFGDVLSMLRDPRCVERHKDYSMGFSSTDRNIK